MLDSGDSNNAAESADKPAAPTEPGIYADIPSEVYHADRNSLSASGAKHLLATCPAQFRYDRDNPPVRSRDYFDVGTGFHTLLFGVGPQIVEIREKDWKTDRARAARERAWAEGKTPLLREQLRTVKAMVAAVRRNEIAATLLSDGTPENSLYWRDEPTGVMLRARPDWLTHAGGRLIIVDGKTADIADPQAFSRAAVNLAYACQAAWYMDAVIALGLDLNPAFVFLVVAKRAPHLISIIELDADAIAWGAARNRRAIDIYSDCMESDDWPSYGNEIHLVGLPRWAYYQEQSL